MTTPEEAILCALSRSDSIGTGENGFTHGNKGVLRLVPTRYIVPTDSVSLLSVCGTLDGRIFMGGYDGCLYEMDYEAFLSHPQQQQQQPPMSLEERLDAFYDGDDPNFSFENANKQSVTQQMASSGKRALSSIVFGSNYGNSPNSQPRKCRKLNHSSNASSIANAIVPGFLLKVSSSIFGNGHSSTGGGPIVNIVMDEERSCLYTLSSRGWICVFDLASSTSPGSTTTKSSSPQAKLVAVMDAPKTARLYLEAVSRARNSPPSSIGSSSIANIIFPGGASSAQAGVGGMDGARSILKLADSEMQRHRNSSRGTKKIHRDTHGKSVLTPVSLHIVPRRESGRLTLVAITSGGLRYYISSLSSHVLNTGPGQHFASSRNTDPLAPFRKFTLCHIRSPPPVGQTGRLDALPSFESETGNGVDGFVPKVIGSDGKSSRVDASYYGSGVMILSVENNHQSKARNLSENTSRVSNNGDVIVATAPDSVARKKKAPPINYGLSNGLSSIAPSQGQLAQTPHLSFIPPGGVCETLSLPMVSMSGASSMELAPTLPGGRVWAISSGAAQESSTLYLSLSSETPKDVELRFGMVPAYFPPSRLRHRDEVRPVGGSTDSNTSSPLGVVEANARSNALVVVPGGGSNTSVTSVAFTVFSNFLFSRPLRQGLSLQMPFSQMEGGPLDGRTQEQSYRISARYGCRGFAFAGDGKSARGKGSRSIASVTRTPSAQKKASTSMAARLSPWLLQPAVMPLNPLAVQHLLPSKSIVALNSGGLHSFQCTSILTNLADALMSAGVNIKRDEAVTSFFRSYGYKEGCSMCLSLAIGCGPGAASGSAGEELRSRALQAALARAYLPKLALKETINSTPSAPTSISDAGVPPGYKFHPSSLSGGVTTVLSRLLRPVWHKPAVVVTEGRSIPSKGGSSMIAPAKVELLLDDLTLEEIRKPLHAVQALMREVFTPAISVVPGVQRQDSDIMDVEDDARREHIHLMTRTMQNQGFTQNQNFPTGAVPQLSSAEGDSIARVIEERQLHSIYRLVSRAVQLLNLLSLLKRAQLMPDLPEVEWGLLHGLTFAQLAQTSDGHERVETLLNSLVSSGASATNVPVTPSADADRLANLFASQCYLFFSPGSRLAYLGFRSAHAALGCAQGTANRAALTNQASSYLKRAARYWYSATLITGRILHAKDKRSYQQMALRAMQFDSPLAKAAAALIQLEDVVGVVDLCLETAFNFGGRRITQQSRDMVDVSADNKSAFMLFWEQGLYHRRRAGSDQSSDANTQNGLLSASSAAPVSGADVTPKDALRTCHAIIFHHLSTLLDSSNRALADRMVAACSASSDNSFLQSFYEHLLKTSRVDTLLRIDSGEVENWLKIQTDSANLLWRHYMLLGKNALAGEVMWKRACDSQVEATVDERMEYLTRAMSSYNEALQDSASGGMQWNDSNPANRADLERVITQIRETLDVAILQRRLLNAISSSALEEKLEGALYSTLKSTLVPVSDLYNDYAGPLNLFDLCLLILHSCQHNDTNTIEILWKSILSEELVPCATRSKSAYHFLQNLITGSLVEENIVLVSGEHNRNNSGLPLFENRDWLNRLKGRIISLGKELFGKGADYVFPVEFIIANLEGKFRLLLCSFAL